MPRGFRIEWDPRKRQWWVRQGERRRATTRLTIQVPTWDEDGSGALLGNGVVRTLARGDIVITA